MMVSVLKLLIEVLPSSAPTDVSPENSKWKIVTKGISQGAIVKR